MTCICSQNSKICCTRYRRSPVPIQRIKGYREQPVTENCRIEAIIFYMPDKIEVCATQEDAWVRRALALLSFSLDVDLKMRTSFANLNLLLLLQHCE
uniref:C-C motif chemokine 20-like n=1 Tax=Seriola dumerili TaxID=41447 RepID=A0A3B4UPJ0_SERDU